MPSDAVRVFVPGSIGNVGPGLDILGLALDGPGDSVEIEWADQPGIEVTDPGHPTLPRESDRNTASLAAAAVFRIAGTTRGTRLKVIKGLPLSAGQGGSAASAVAGAVAANLLAGAEFSDQQLMSAALEAESKSSGNHADNLAPSLLGGLVLIRSMDPLDTISLPVPEDLYLVLVHPDYQLATRAARGVLPAQVTREVAIAQAARVAALVAGACLGDVGMLGRAIDDLIAEPVRQELLPGFVMAKAAALEAGAFGCSISGAGPTSFAVVDNPTSGNEVLQAMIGAYRDSSITATGRIARPDLKGARPT